MKTCPNCGELLGDNVTSCFKCRYDYNLKRVLTSEENHAMRENRDRVIEQKNRASENVRIAEERNKIEQNALMEKRLLERQQSMNAAPVDVLLLNDTYEYDVVPVTDRTNGAPSIYTMQKILSDHAREGWRLVSMVNNELGVNSTVVSAGSVAVGRNSTRDVTIMVFERCIYRVPRS
jgi:hypothetical protein